RSQAVEWHELAAACKQSRGRGEVLPRAGAPARGAAHAHPNLPARLANDRWFHLRADQPRTFAAISATRRPNARAMARSSGFGCNSPCPPAMVVAPYGVPP